MFCMYVPMILLFVSVQSILQIAQDQKKKKKNQETRNKDVVSYHRDGIMQSNTSVFCIIVTYFSLHPSQSLQSTIYTYCFYT